MICILILHLGLCFKKETKNPETVPNTPEVQLGDRASNYGHGMFGNLQMNKEVEEAAQVNRMEANQQRPATDGSFQPEEPRSRI
mmetsp:Transcript_14873/g.16576  ORF Transcript_14873/g.16576 Transcript_14873/m.16576 type:complete len:84 (+) Transcript_14873:820-1071(+)